MQKSINLFYTHLEYPPTTLPFPEVSSSLRAESHAKTSERLHCKFALVANRIAFVDEICSPLKFGLSSCESLFKHFMNRNLLLYMIVDFFELRMYRIFEPGDPAQETKLVDLVLYILNGIDFDISILSSWIYNIALNTPRSPRACSIPHDRSKSKELKRLETSFNEQVLSMRETELKEDLKEIKSRYDLHDIRERDKYCQQFEGPIFEEIRAGLCQAKRALEMKREKKDAIFLRLKNPNTRQDAQVQEFSCDIVSPGMDKNLLDHSPNSEVALLTIDGFKIRGILTSFELEEHKSKYTRCKLLILREHAQLLRKTDTTIKANILLSIMTYGRMLTACRHENKSWLMDPIISGILPGESGFTEDQAFVRNTIARSLVIDGHVNHKQADVISEFTVARDGLYLLRGPPGTGKTTAIVYLLKHMLEVNPNQRIMITAPSNAAVHTLAERAISVLGPEISMVFTGIEKNLSTAMRSIFVNRINWRLCNSIQTEIKLLENEKKWSNDARISRTIIERLSEHEEIFEKLRNRFIVGDEGDNEQQEKYMHLRFDYTVDLKSKIRQLLIELDKHLPTLRHAANYLRDACVSSFERDYQRDQSALEQFKSAFETYESILCRDFTVSESILEVFMLQQSQLIFCTLCTSGGKFLQKSLPRIDALIIDEAGQAVEPEVLIPLYYHPAKCLQVGDNKQLPPTILSPRNVEIKYDYSMMSRLIDRVGVHSQMLEIQYRMHPAICAWPSQQYYDGLLRADSSLNHRPALLSGNTGVCDTLRHQCLFIDVADGVESGKTARDTSSSNDKEVDCAFALVKHLVAHGVERKSIGVIAFYATQTALLRKKIPYKEVKVSTVDSFQGMECDIILLCTTRTVVSAGFLHDFRRLNVAVTRARHHLYILGHQEALRKSNTDFSCLLRFYDQEIGNARRKAVIEDSAAEEEKGDHSIHSRSTPTAAAVPDAPLISSIASSFAIVDSKDLIARL